MITLKGTLDSEVVDLRVDRLVLGAFTGRDESSRQAHIEELRTHGVIPSGGTASFFFVPPELLTMDELIVVSADKTSGEAEFVLFERAGELLVGVGSDHTDRVLETVDIRLAKLACPKIVSRHIWRFNDLRRHWDSLMLRSWVEEAGALVLYQEAPLKHLMRPDDLVDLVATVSGRDLYQTALFSGTIPTVRKELRLSRFFRGELEDPILRRTLRIAYRICGTSRS